MSLDLSAAIDAARADDAVFRATTIGDVVRTSVTAAAPLIEAQVRAQIVADIDYQIADERSVDMPSRPRIAALQIARTIAKGDS